MAHLMTTLIQHVFPRFTIQGYGPLPKEPARRPQTHVSDGTCIACIRSSTCLHQDSRSSNFSCSSFAIPCAIVSFCAVAICLVDRSCQSHIRNCCSSVTSHQHVSNGSTRITLITLGQQ